MWLKNFWQFSITKTQDRKDYLLADVRRYNMLFSSLTHLYFSVVKGPKTEGSILPTCLFLYFAEVKNKF